MNTESRTLLGTCKVLPYLMVWTWNKEIYRSKKQSTSWLWNVPIFKWCLVCLIPTKPKVKVRKIHFKVFLKRFWDGWLKKRCHVVMSDTEVSGRFCWLCTERSRLFPPVSSPCSSIHLSYSSTYFPESQHFCLIWCSGLDLIHITAISIRSTWISEA